MGTGRREGGRRGREGEGGNGEEDEGRRGKAWKRRWGGEGEKERRVRRKREGNKNGEEKRREGREALEHGTEHPRKVGVEAGRGWHCNPCNARRRQRGRWQ